MLVPSAMSPSAIVPYGPAAPNVSAKVESEVNVVAPGPVVECSVRKRPSWASVTMSSNPSPSMSATPTCAASSVIAGALAGAIAKSGANATCTGSEPLAKTMSSRPSRLKSPAATSTATPANEKLGPRDHPRRGIVAVARVVEDLDRIDPADGEVVATVAVEVTDGDRAGALRGLLRRHSEAALRGRPRGERE